MLLAGTVAHLSACGGGGADLNIAGVTSGGTGSFTRGTITGFGSVIVNGVRYDIEAAEILEGGRLRRSGEDLALGMVVDIVGSARRSSGSANGLLRAQAYRISFESPWVGPVDDVDAGATPSRFKLLGQDVEVSGTTLVTGLADQISGIRAGQYAKVYGYVDSETLLIHATRVETSATRPDEFTLTGVIRAIDRTARSATVGNTTIFWTSSAEEPAPGVTVGSLVKATLAPDTSGAALELAWMEAIDAPTVELPERGDDSEIEVHGTISRLQSSTDFYVNGIPVRVDAGTALPSGELRNGVAVEIKGRLRGARLHATEIEIKSGSRPGRESFEFYGRPENITSDHFTLKGLLFRYDRFTEGAENLSRLPVPHLEIKARLTDGRWQAVEIEIED